MRFQCDIMKECARTNQCIMGGEDCGMFIKPPTNVFFAKKKTWLPGFMALNLLVNKISLPHDEEKEGTR